MNAPSPNRSDRRRADPEAREGLPAPVPLMPTDEDFAFLADLEYPTVIFPEHGHWAEWE